ncbi:MAG TPA: TonB-dependent receptor [Deltaproteobacteria bacterium]|nr:TonB-dependent receptor [Deltaproteobacteria bacterium]
MFYRGSRMFLFTVISFVLFMPSVWAEEIVITAANFEDATPETVAGKAPTSFTETVTICPLANGLIDTLDALRLPVDVDLPDYGGAVPSPISIRGSNFQQTLVMLDGVPLSSSVGDIVDLSLYTIPEIDRIEIIKGSNSAAFGSAAMGGIVNIVTKRPSLNNSALFTASKGTYGYNLYNLMLNGEKWGQGLMIDLTKSWADKDFLYEKDDGSTARRENNHFENTSILSKLLLDVSGWDTSLSGSIADQTLGSPGSEGSMGVLTPDDEVRTRQYFITLNTSKYFGPDQNVQLKASRIATRTHNLTSYAGDVWSKLTSDYIELDYSKKVGIFGISPGAAWRREGISSDDYGIHDRTTGSGFLTTSLNFEPVLVSVTGRRDQSSDFDGRWTYHGGIVWRAFQHLSVKANIGTGFHEPTMGHLYTPSSWYAFISNPDLRPEKSFSWDIGPVIEYKNFGMSVSYFVTRYKDLIKMDFPALSTFTYVNVDRAHASGIEALFWTKPADPVKISLGYAFNQFRYGSGAFESKTIKLKPKQVFTLQTDYLPVLFGRQTDFFASYRFRQGAYMDDANTEKTGNRDILDAGVSVEVIKHAVLSFKVNNIFDDTSVEFEDKTAYGTYWYPLPGRTYRGSIQLSF